MKSSMKGLELDTQKRIIDGLLVSVENSELICQGCWRALKGRYYAVSNGKFRIMLCVGCFKLIQTLWRLKKLDLFDLKTLKIEEIECN